MRAFRQEPYLWLHIAGLAVIPLWGLGLWLAIAAGDLLLPYGVEQSLLVILGVAPWLWIQWQRPFNPFSLLVASLPPNRLTDSQLKWLSLLKRRRNRNFAVLAVFPMVWLLGQCFQLAPLASSVTPIHNHGVGLLLGTIIFSGANLFMQVSLSMVGLLLLTSEAQFEAAEPYDLKNVRSDFFRFGLELPQILPPLVMPLAPPTNAANPSAEVAPVQPDIANDPVPEIKDDSKNESLETQDAEDSPVKSVEVIEDVISKSAEATETNDEMDEVQEVEDHPAEAKSESDNSTPDPIDSGEDTAEVEAEPDEAGDAETIAPEPTVLTDEEVADELDEVDVGEVEVMADEPDGSEVKE